MTYKITILFKNGYVFTDFMRCETDDEKEALATTVQICATHFKNNVSGCISVCDTVIRSSEIVFMTLEEWGAE